MKMEEELAMLHYEMQMQEQAMEASILDAVLEYI